MSRSGSDGGLVRDVAMLRRFWPFARPDAWALALALVVTPVVAAASLAQPWLLKEAIDAHIVPGRPDGLGRLALYYLGAALAVYVLEAGYTLAIAWAGQRTLLRLRTALYRHALGLKQTFFDRQPTGKLLTRITSDVETLGEALSAGIITILLDALIIVGTLGAMLWLEWRLTLVMLALAPPMLFVLDLLRRRLKALFIEIREALATVNAYLAERVDGMEVVQLFRHEAACRDQFESLDRRFRDATQESNLYDALLYSLVDGFAAVCVALMLWYGSGALSVWLGIDVGAGSVVSAGLLVAFVDYLDRLFRPLRDAAGKIAFIQRAGAALDKILGLFEDGEPCDPGRVPIERIEGHVELRDVRYRYKEDAEDVLCGVDLEIRPGEVVAVVGATGSGKTTLSRLLDRSYDGYRGSIRLDGIELSEVRTADLRKHMSAVRQDIQLFSEEMRFNVDLGNPTVTPERCDEAAAQVHADRVVSSRGWDHVLRERGADLSVGEGQLLTFARAMARHPSLLVLDEATASVDSVTESLVQDAIGRILEGRTVLVIAHRLSTIQRAHRIAVMEHGRIVEQGTHGELMARGGRYAALVAAGGEVVSGR